MNKMNHTGKSLFASTTTRRGVSRNALTFTFITAIIFALTFTFFGCSEGGSGENSDGDSEFVICKIEDECYDEDYGTERACERAGGEVFSSIGACNGGSDNSSSFSEENYDDKSSSSSKKNSSSSVGSTDNSGTVKIGEQVWMKKNLDVVPTGANGAATNSWCNGDEPFSSNKAADDNCTTYGRLYDWATAMALPASCNSSSCASQVQSKHRGICPEGFHIPTNADWNELYHFVDGTLTLSTNLNSNYSSPTGGTMLKSSTLWNSYNGIPVGTGDNGFAALPGGVRDSYGSFSYVGSLGDWWSASELNSGLAYTRGMYSNYESATWGNGSKTNGLSVRCVQD